MTDTQDFAKAAAEDVRTMVATAVSMHLGYDGAIGSDSDAAIESVITRHAAPVLAAKDAEIARTKSRCEALEKLCACYRCGTRPSEKLLKELERTRLSNAD